MTWDVEMREYEMAYAERLPECTRCDRKLADSRFMNHRAELTPLLPELPCRKGMGRD